MNFLVSNSSKDPAYPEVDVSVVIVTAKNVGILLCASASLLIIQFIAGMAGMNFKGEALRKTLKELRTEKENHGKKERKQVGANISTQMLSAGKLHTIHVLLSSSWI